MRVASLLSALVVLAATAGVALPIARACNLVPPTWTERPWSLTDPDDVTAPSTPAVITGDASAPEAAEGCGSGDLDDGDPGDCSTVGTLTIYIEEPAADDRTAPEQMAYRVEVIEGDAPFPTDVPIHTVDFGEGSPALFVHLNEAKVSAKVRVIPVDAGGNEGPPSNVIHLRFDESGCSTLGASSLSNLAPTGLILLWLLAQRRRKPALASVRRRGGLGRDRKL